MCKIYKANLDTNIFFCVLFILLFYIFVYLMIRKKLSTQKKSVKEMLKLAFLKKISILNTKQKLSGFVALIDLFGDESGLLINIKKYLLFYARTLFQQERHVLSYSCISSKYGHLHTMPIYRHRSCRFLWRWKRFWRLLAFRFFTFEHPKWSCIGLQARFVIYILNLNGYIPNAYTRTIRKSFKNLDIL